MRDLGISEGELVTERREIEERIAALNEEKEAASDLLKSELEPKAADLKRTLAEYRKAMEIQDEFSFISNLEISMRSELFEAETADDETELLFSIKSRFDRSILDQFDEHIENILKACQYEGLGSARLGQGSFDILVNEKDKSTFGKGYRAYLNTVLALALLEFLAEHGKHSPGLLIADSPILSLKERGREKTSDSMKTALFRYMCNHQENGQVIIIENDIPELDYGGHVNVIRFTKDETQGRYGFLNDVR